MSDYPAPFMNFSSSVPQKQHNNGNLPIPEAAMDLGVSETRLRKTLAEGSFTTEVELRQTRTGVRKTVMLPPATVEQLHKHFRALEKNGFPLPGSQPSGWQYPTRANDTDEDAEYQESRRVRESAEEAAYLEQKMKEKNRHLEDALAAVDSLPPGPETRAAPAVGSGSSPGVPVDQFNALLYQHNVLREDLGRVSQYLADCDHLLEEMIKTIVTLEERMQSLEHNRPPARSSAISGALRSVSEGIHNAFTKRKPASSRPALKPSEVYYANVLSRP